MSLKCSLSWLVHDLDSICYTGYSGQKRWCVLHGVIGDKSQLKLGHCCTYTASSHACPPLVVVPATVLPLPCSSNPRLQQFKGISITISSSGLFGHCSVLLPLPLSQRGLLHGPQPLQGYTCCRLDFSTTRDALGCPTPAWTYSQVKSFQLS